MNNSDQNSVIGKGTQRRFPVQVPIMTVSNRVCGLNKTAMKYLRLRPDSGLMIQINRNKENPTVYIRLDSQEPDYRIKVQTGKDNGVINDMPLVKELKSIFGNGCIRFAIDLVQDQRGRHKLNLML